MKLKLFFFSVILTTLAVPKMAIAYDFQAVSPSGHLLNYNFYDEGVEVFKSGSPSGLLIIPDSVEYNNISYRVKKIGQDAFYGCQQLSDVIIPASITIIGTSAFWGCFGISMLSVPSSVVEIGYGAFFGVNMLFYIGTASGTWGEKMRNGYIENGLCYTSSSKDTLAGVCSYVTIVDNIPGSVSVIKDRAFRANNNVERIVVPLSVVSVGYETFAYCNNLKSVVFENSDISIGHYAFYNSMSLSEIVFTSAGQPSVSDAASVLWDAIIKVPCGASSLFSSITAFSNNQIKEIGCHVNINVIPSDASLGYCMGSGIYEVGDTISIVAIPKDHCHFISWNEDIVQNPYILIAEQDTTITAIFSRPDTTFLHDTTYIDVPYAVHDTTYINVHDTTYINVHDTTYIDVPYTVHDTTYINVHDTTYIDVPYAVHDTTYINVHDTTYIDVPYAVHDTTYINVHDTTYVDVPYAVHDTTVVIDTVTLTEYVPVHDTTTIRDTTYLPVYIHDTTTIRDTTYLPVYLHDTTYINVHDTTYIDVPYAVHDTTYITMTDTITNTIYDTITNTVYDTIDNFIHDTTLVTDTLWLTLYDTLWLHDTIIVHDTIYITQEGIGDVEAVSAKVYSSQGQIVVEGAAGKTVMLYDVNGRVLATRRDELAPLCFDVPASGTYMLRIGNLRTRKVVVIR